MNYLVCYEVGTVAGYISGDCVIRNGSRLTESYIQELRVFVRETVVNDMEKELPQGTQLKKLIFRSITKLAD